MIKFVDSSIKISTKSDSSLEEDMAVGRDPLMPHEAPDHNPFAMRGSKYPIHPKIASHGRPPQLLVKLTDL